jgi:hypothetical protein
MLCSQGTQFVYINDTTMAGYLEINNSIQGFGNLAVTANQFTRFTITYDNSNIKKYKNGVLVDTTAISGVFTSTVFPLGGGKLFEFGGASTGSYYKGIISTVRIYNRALTANEVSIIHKANIPRYS